MIVLKNKLNQDQVAMIIADWVDGELTTCTDIPVGCSGCPLDKEFKGSLTICGVLEMMAEKLNEVEK